MNLHGSAEVSLNIADLAVLFACLKIKIILYRLVAHHKCSEDEF
jgi:hypothetical protein